MTSSRVDAARNSVPACAGCGAALPPNKAPGRPRKWCSERCRKQTLYSTPCVDCGAPTTGDGQYHERCARCSYIDTDRQARATATQRAKWLEHKTMIEAMWADGLTTAQIREATGITSFVAGPYRARGYDLPRRYASPLAGSRTLRGRDRSSIVDADLDARVDRRRATVGRGGPPFRSAA